MCKYLISLELLRGRGADESRRFVAMYASGVCCHILWRILKAEKATKRLARRFQIQQRQEDGGDPHGTLGMDCDWRGMETSESLKRRNVGVNTNKQP